jgi:hypothetical protein
MLTYADVCWRMLTYADVCWRMLTYADVCIRTLYSEHPEWSVIDVTGRAGSFIHSFIHSCMHAFIPWFIIHYSYIHSFMNQICIQRGAHGRRTLWLRNHTTAALYVSSYCYICVPILLYMCPHTAIYVSWYCYIRVLILVYPGAVDENAAIIAELLYTCPHTAIYVSSYCYICVRILEQWRRTRQS